MRVFVLVGCSAAGTEGSPLARPEAGLEPGSPAPDGREKPGALPSLSSKFKKAPPLSDPGTKSTKEDVSENTSAKPGQSSPGPDHLCDATAGDDHLSQLCEPGNLTGDQSKAAQDVAGTPSESPQDGAAVEAAGQLSPGPSARAEGDGAQGPSVLSGRDAGGEAGAEEAPHSAGAPAGERPSPPLDKAPEGHSEAGGAPEQSSGDQCEENKAGQRVQAHSPVKEKISSLRKVDRGHYRHRRDRSSSGERPRDGRSKTEDRYHRRRHPSVRERALQGRFRPEHCGGGPHHPCPRHGQPRHRHHRSRSRGRSDQGWGTYRHSEGGHSWGREKCCPDKRRWDKCRYYHDRYAPYTAREAWEWRPLHGDRDYDRVGLHGGQPHKDCYRGRRGCELAARAQERHRFSSPRAGLPHAPLPCPEKYPHEKTALGPEGSSCHLADQFHKHENVKSRKRRYDGTEHNDSYVEKKAWRSSPRGPLEEPKVKKHKKSKKKKKSKDKRRERDSR